MPLYLSRETLANNDQAASAAKTTGLVTDIARQWTEAQQPEQPAFALPSLSDLGVSDAPSPVMSAIGAVGQRVQRAASDFGSMFSLPSLESLGVLPEQQPQAPRPTVEATFEDGRTEAQPQLQPGETVGSVEVSAGRRQSVGETSAPPSGDIDNSSRQAFVRSAWPHMLEAAGGNQDAAEMMLAAAISENGSIGTGRPFWANNFFGIKGKGDAGSVTADTHEIVNGQRVDMPDAFAAYSSPAAGFRAFFDFLQNNSRYAGALQRYQQTGDASQLFRDVNAAGYATDTEWASKVENIRRNQVAPITRGVAQAAAPAAEPPSQTPAGAQSPPAGVSPLDQARASTGGAQDVMLRQPMDEAPPDGGYVDPDQGPRESGYTVPAAGDAGSAGAPFSGSGLPAVPSQASVEEDNPNRLPPAYDVQISQGGSPTPSAEWTPVETAPRQPAPQVAEQELAPREPALPAYGPEAPSASPAISAAQTARSAVEEGLELAPRPLPNPTAPAARVYERTIEEARADEDRFFTESAPTIAEFSRETGVPLEQIHRGLRIARDIALATPQAAADTINAALEPLGLGRESIGLALPVVGTIGLADIVDVKGVSVIGVGRAGALRSAPTRVGEAVAGVVPNIAEPIERATGAVARGAGEAIQEGASRVRGALAPNAERVAAADARMAEQGSVTAPGVFGISGLTPDTPGVQGVRPRVIPPNVADELDFPVRLPEDPAVIRAIEAAGGTVDERGVTLGVTRAQSPAGAGAPATRGMVFYEAVPEGGRSSFVGGDDPTKVGGSQVIPRTPTRFRSPLILSDAPGAMQGFDEAAEQIGIRGPVDQEKVQRLRAVVEIAKNDVDRGLGTQEHIDEAQRQLEAALRGETKSTDIDRAIRQARAAGPEGSPARAAALKDVVARYGGEPGLVDDLLKIRGADASESAWAIKENIVAANARRQGYDGVVTVQQQIPSPEEIAKMPAVVEAKAVVKQASDELNAL
jgi:flagellum-specific peptidoglycan hydrolase FlgJ